MVLSEKDIEKLWTSYDSKVRIFDLIRAGNNEEATKLLKKDNEAVDYFKKFRSEKHMKPDSFGETTQLDIIWPTLNKDESRGWKVFYNHHAEGKILEDLDKLRERIERKELEYESVKDRIEIKELEYRSAKDRERMKWLTGVLAVGTGISAIYYAIQIIAFF